MRQNSGAFFRAEVGCISKIVAVDNILEVICQTTNMRFAAVCHLTAANLTVCAVKDLAGCGIGIGESFKLNVGCADASWVRKTIISGDVVGDGLVKKGSSSCIGDFRSYISVPILLKDGRVFGNLCAFDPLPMKLKVAEIKQLFNLYADLIAFQLTTLEQLSASEISLKEEQQTSELRDQFIAVLGHDLRNPVSAIRNSAQLLQRTSLNVRDSRLVQMIQDSTFRMTGLIENILDFARGRLGEGIFLNLQHNEPVDISLRQVVDELKVIWPSRKIDCNFKIHQIFSYDNTRISQLFSNLLGNALTYGDPLQPITVDVIADQRGFFLSVTNLGPEIPEEKLGNLFQPFHRGGTAQNKQGLGLGLFIASEIAKAHRGELKVSSRARETCFTLHIPG